MPHADTQVWDSQLNPRYLQLRNKVLNRRPMCRHTNSPVRREKATETETEKIGTGIEIEKIGTGIETERIEIGTEIERTEIGTETEIALREIVREIAMNEITPPEITAIGIGHMTTETDHMTGHMINETGHMILEGLMMNGPESIDHIVRVSVVAVDKVGVNVDHNNKLSISPQILLPMLWDISSKDMGLHKDITVIKTLLKPDRLIINLPHLLSHLTLLPNHHTLNPQRPQTHPRVNSR